jgi:hypothetical protein
MKLNTLFPRLLGTIHMTCLDPSNVSGNKTTLLPNTHLAASNQINSIVRMPVKPGMEMRGKICLDQKRLTGS